MCSAFSPKKMPDGRLARLSNADVSSHDAKIVRPPRLVGTSFEYDFVNSHRPAPIGQRSPKIVFSSTNLEKMLMENRLRDTHLTPNKNLEDSWRDVHTFAGVRECRGVAKPFHGVQVNCETYLAVSASDWDLKASGTPAAQKGVELEDQDKYDPGEPKFVLSPYCSRGLQKRRLPKGTPVMKMVPSWFFDNS
eukprot:TRINITY_DN44723_c0_g1_i1.p1 TRINITY_DN44723_c0_g1~~TRINITY_DN44723_c0_g1_i1.p1  ORF type:complete len:192 (+),score=29.80 TRINITY_DN44723_c0_g1_i1:118-693(+)